MKIWTMNKLREEKKFNDKEIAESKWADICMIVEFTDVKKESGLMLKPIISRKTEKWNPGPEIIHYGGLTCSFCDSYQWGCIDGKKLCPIYEETGKKTCRATPFNKFSIALRERNQEKIKKYANKMLELIKRLETERQ